MAHDVVPPEPASPGPEPAPKAPKAVLLGATAVLSGFVAMQGPALWNEWAGLQRDWNRSKLSQPMGYVNIAPAPSYAHAPKEWMVMEGDQVSIWSGWTPGLGHGWFRFGKDDMDLSKIGTPLGRDTIRAIDYPIVETGQGTIWSQLYDEVPVVALMFNGVPCAYPLLVVEKVEVINDTVGGKPLLVVHTPFVSKSEAVDTFDPMTEDGRLSFGLSGYFYGKEQRPFLYDRKTESLWLVQDHRLNCVAGPLKGTSLKHIARLQPREWGTWVSQYPQTRLVVGANRPRPQPSAPPANKEGERVTSVPTPARGA